MSKFKILNNFRIKTFNVSLVPLPFESLFKIGNSSIQPLQETKHFSFKLPVRYRWTPYTLREKMTKISNPTLLHSTMTIGNRGVQWPPRSSTSHPGINWAVYENYYTESFSMQSPAQNAECATAYRNTCFAIKGTPLSLSRSLFMHTKHSNSGFVSLHTRCNCSENATRVCEKMQSWWGRRRRRRWSI